eukprot:COSAG05_NODE_436_length_9838_cov_49.389876_6_plen_114_part_00
MCLRILQAMRQPPSSGPSTSSLQRPRAGATPSATSMFRQGSRFGELEEEEDDEEEEDSYVDASPGLGTTPPRLRHLQAQEWAEQQVQFIPSDDDSSADQVLFLIFFVRTASCF